MRMLPIAAALLAAHLGAAQAATITVDATQAPGASFLQLQQFNPELGLLSQVTLTLTGSITGWAKAENMGATPGQITLTLKTGLSLLQPGTTNVLVTVAPTVQRTFAASGFDGSLDHAGTSGIQLTGLSNSATASVDFFDEPTREMFSGFGTIDLPLLVTRMSSIDGPGNLDGAFSSRRSVFAQATYHYGPGPYQEVTPFFETSPVPEPGTWALMFAGLGLVGWLAKRRAA